MLNNGAIQGGIWKMHFTLIAVFQLLFRKIKDVREEMERNVIHWHLVVLI
jgi:hypothetical protein